jgi:hypothetical protein
MSNKKVNYIAVSEIIGTILILAISVSLFSFVYLSLFFLSPQSEKPIADIIGMTADEKNIIFSHMGGEELSLDSLVIISVGGKEIIQTVGDLLDEKSSEDGYWNIGEELVINYDIRDLQVTARIVDKNSNSVIMMGILQEGDLIRDPYVFTINATDIKAISAKLTMGYNFWGDSGSVRFSYRISGGSWLYTSWVSMSGENTYTSNISGLVVNTLYEYKAQLKWEINLTEGGVKKFTTAIPTVETLDATDVKTRSAKLWMQYDFKGISGSISFSYKIIGGSWIDTSWLNVSGQGIYCESIFNLLAKKIYEFKARLKYNANVIEGGHKSFTTWSIIMGMWTFSEGINSTAFDTSGLENHGTIFGADWTIGVNTTGLSFDGIDDYITVYDSSSLDITEDISIEAWIKSSDNSEGLIGDITNSLIDSSWFGPDYGYDSDLIKISNELYAIAFRGDNSRGYIVTVFIDNSGLIKNIIDYFEFELNYCYEPDIVNIRNDIYAIVYEGPDNDGFIKTVNIDSNGLITDAIIDTLEFDTFNGEDPYILHINGSIYAIAYVGLNYDGYAKTVEILDNGMISDSVIDTTIFCDTEPGVEIAEPQIIYVGNSNYAIIFRNPDDDGEVRTVTILDNGMFSSPSKSDGSFVNKFTFDQYDGWRPNIRMTHINSNIFVVCYRGRDGRGTLVTIDISNTAVIQQDIIDKLYFEPNECYEPELLYITGNYYAIVYRGVDNDGYLIIVEISGDGMITDSIINVYEFDTSDCYKPIILHHTADIFIIAYTRYNEGLLKTVKIPSNGDISSVSPIIHDSRYTLFDFIESDIIHVNGEIYAIACRGLNSDGYLRSLQISNSGIINNKVIDHLEFDRLDGREPKIIHISGNIYTICYRGVNDDGFIKTVQILNDGQITDSIIDNLEFDTSAGYEPDIIHISGNIYAIAYRGSSNHGIVKTVEITTGGLITDTFIDMLEFENSYGFEPDIIHISGNIYAIAYRGPGDDGFVKTFEIMDTGEIQNSIIDYYEYDTQNGFEPEIINISNNIYAILHSYQYLGGYLTTIEILNNGIITKSVIDSTRFDYREPSGDDDCYDPHIIHIGEWVYAIVYRGEHDGYIKTLRIGISGDISDVNDDYLMFDVDGFEPQIIHIYGDIYAIPFKESSSNANLVTIEIKITPTIRDVVFKKNAYGIKADGTMVYGHINNEVISAPLSSGFNYIVLTYNRSLSSNQMKLYINGVLQTERSESSTINNNDYNLIMGEYNCILDEVTIWNVPIDNNLILTNYNLFKP